GDDDSGETLAETRHDVQRLRRTVAEQLNAVQGVVELREQRIGRDAGAASAARSDEIVDRRPVTPDDRRPFLFVAPVAALSEPRAGDQLIRDSLKCRDDDDERLPARFVED